MRARPVRTLGAVLAIALGTGAVVWVTCCYESVRRAVAEWAAGYVGRSHVTVESPFGKYDTISDRVLENISKVPAVEHVTPLLVRRLRSRALPRADYEANPAEAHKWRDDLEEIDVQGIALPEEFRIRDHKVVAGRMLEPDDEYVALLESSYAEEKKLKLGDVVLVWARRREVPYELKIVGLVERRRIAKFQKGLAIVRLPVLQEIDVRQGQITSADVVLRNPDEIARGVRLVHAAVRPVDPTATIASAESRMRQIEKAQEQQRLVLVLLSSVAMLTALFIILSTLSIGMIERISQLGLMRCIGLTGGQLGLLVLFEVVPLGLGGIIAGIPIGLGLTALTVWVVPEYVGQFTVSLSGIALACGAGLTTTLVAALLPAAAATRVSPMEAARPRARRARLYPVIVAGVLAAAALAAQVYVVQVYVQRSPDIVTWSSLSVVLLYAVYACAAPVAVAAAGTLTVLLVAMLVRVRGRLLQDQVGHAVWRSAGICCGLMVGLSLIVGLAVFNRSFQAGWQFPKEFPEAYFWSNSEIPNDKLDDVRDIQGISQLTACNALNVFVDEKPLFGGPLVHSVTWFLGCDPDTFFDMVKLQFMEGDEQTAKELLAQGGHVIIAADFARSRNRKVGDNVNVFFGNSVKTFKVAAVIDSPGLDIAAGYFQAQSEMRVVANGSVLGTRADLEKWLGKRTWRLLLMDLNLPAQPPPADWPPPPGASATKLPEFVYEERLLLSRRWQRYREQMVLNEVSRELGQPTGFIGTARELKDDIDARINEMTQLLSAVPAVALLVAAIGVANLMTANVTSRAKQLAIMRAVGATRGLILRMVVGEALVLGLLGSALGLALGLHLAWNTTLMTQRMWGYNTPFEVPWLYVGAAVTLTIGLCVLAGILPARHASRTNVIDALHVP